MREVVAELSPEGWMGEMEKEGHKWGFPQVVGTWKACLKKSETLVTQCKIRGQWRKSSLVICEWPRALSFPSPCNSFIIGPKQRDTITSLLEMGSLVQDG